MTAQLLRNANVYTRGVSAAQALVIEDGRIVWLGTDAQADSFAHLPTVDCGGLWLAPAFADAHVHITNAGIELSTVSLKTVHSPQELRSAVTSQLEASVVIAHGWDDTNWLKSPEASDIESTMPIYASRVDVHSALINAALQRLCPGIEELDGWHPSGRVTRAAHAMARTTAYGLVDEESKKLARRLFLSSIAAQGIVAVDEMAGPIVSSQADAAAVAAMGASPEVPDVFVWWGELFGFETAKALGAFGCGGDLFVDGSLGSRTALLRQPYESGEVGARYISEVDVAAHIDQSIRRGVPTAFHAIGDAALDSVLNGFSRAASAHGAALIAAGRHRIEHAEMLSDEHRRLCAELGITLSMQPQFDELWAAESAMYEQRVGARYSAMNDFAAATSAGVSVVFGSDAPVTEPSPWRTIRAATSTHNPAHRISTRAAFAAVTRGFWRNHGVEDCGMIEVGAVASLALWEVAAFEELRTDPTIKRWSTDPRSGNRPLPDLSVDTPTCLMTWKRGNLMYDGRGSA